MLEKICHRPEAHSHLSAYCGNLIKKEGDGGEVSVGLHPILLSDGASVFLK